MMPAAQKDVCLKCHGTQAELDRTVQEGKLSPAVRPSSIDAALSQPFVHPMSDQAFSRWEPGVVTCTSCHSPHRSTAGRAVGAATTGQNPSTRDPLRLEYELCQECHGNQGVDTQSLLDISRLFNLNSRSYHPVEGPVREGSISVVASLAGQMISCTHCHGNSDPSGPAGPHGSGVRYILGAGYQTTDGVPESESAYALCYRCHDRETVLDSPVFPEHRFHIVEQRASCATCHNAHGSVSNRALIRFGEETYVAGVSPSLEADRLEFVSDAAGSGACYVSCHGYDHAPAYYGGGVPSPDTIPPWPTSSGFGIPPK
jgi:cytochrome c553